MKKAEELLKLLIGIFLLIFALSIAFMGMMIAWFFQIIK